ncbi:PrmA Ribosomal protein L11 methylase [Paracoccaceae bacterium]
MPLFTAQTTLEGDDAAFALAEALERMQPPALTAECYDIEGMAGLVQVSATFALPPNEVMLAVLAEAFGAAAFEVSSLSQTTWSALTTLPGEGPARALAAALEQLDPAPYGIGAFEIEDNSGLWEVGLYLSDAPDPQVLNALVAQFGGKPFVISEVPDVDWVAHVRRELAPVEAGRFFVYGSHDADRVPSDPGRIPLQIEATVAFGTGHHGTTLGCLRAFDRLVEQGIRPAKVVDIGAGTAVLALAAARVFPDAVVIASDIDEVAVDVAEANVAINGLEGRIECLEAAGFAHPRLHEVSPYDLIFANILKGPLIELAPDMGQHCAKDGLVILSGLLAVQAEAVVAAYNVAGFTLVSREDIGEWSALVLKRN